MSKSPTEMLYEWDALTDSPVDQFFPDPDLTRLRLRLIGEEYEEAREELLRFVRSPVDGNRAALAKELADLLYVVYGTGTAMGLDLDHALREVHYSNLTKLTNGKLSRDPGGKVLKGPNYEPPDLDYLNAYEGSADDG